jgi:hypothetical protein
VVDDTSHCFTTPYRGSLPKNEFVHWPVPDMVFVIQLLPEP